MTSFFLHTWHPHGTLIALGGLTIHWYGLTLALGALAGYVVIRRLSTRYQISLAHIDALFLWVVAVGLLGGRLYHVFNELGYYHNHPSEIFQIWHGGLAIHGALIAGVLTLWWYCARHKLNFLLLADVLVPGLAMGQAIGRWGNYFNQELFGRPTSVPWGIPIDPANRPLPYITAQYFHPTFLYESLGNLLIVTFLWWLHQRRLKKLPVAGWSADPRRGQIALTYFILYGLLRILTESLRIDQTPIIAGIRLPILFSSAMIGAAVMTMIVFHQRFSHVQRP